jgi:hypothetical protein
MMIEGWTRDAMLSLEKPTKPPSQTQIAMEYHAKFQTAFAPDQPPRLKVQSPAEKETCINHRQNREVEEQALTEELQEDQV